MRVLMIHNQYQQLGGEEVTFESEKSILESYGHDVKTLVFDNKDIASAIDKVKVLWQFFYNTRSREIVEKAIDEFKPDVIHAYNIFYVASPSIFYAAQSRNVPIVLTIQNYRLICASGFLMRDATVCEICINKKFPLSGIKYRCNHKSAVKSAHVTFATGFHKAIKTWQTKVTRYIAVTDFARRKLINSSLHLREDQVVVKPTSIPDMGVSQVAERDRSLLFVGRIAHEKGIETLLQGFYKKPYTLEIIGDGPMRARVEELAVTSPNIKYLGYQKKDFIIDKLKHTSAMVVTSVWYEGLPSTIMEAFSTGTPVIISNIGNLNEIVTDNHDGLHFKPADPVDLARVVANFMENSDQFKHLYKNARLTYESRYEPRINYQNLVRIYNDVINEAR